MRRLAALAGVALVTTAVVLAIYLYRHRFVRTDDDLVRLLPGGDFNVIFVNMAALRKADIADLFKNIQVAPDDKYRAFVAETGFDYIRDVDAIALAADANQTFLTGLGRVPWERFARFANSHGGSCEGSICVVPASKPGRWIGIKTIQSNVVAVAVSSDRRAIYRFQQAKPGEQSVPQAPLWVEPAHMVLERPLDLPLPLEIFAISLQAAQSVVLTADLNGVYLKAHCSSAATADTVRQQLDIRTKMIQSALGQSGGANTRSTLAGLLASGSFQVIGGDVLGKWQVYPELVRALRQ